MAENERGQDRSVIEGVSEHVKSNLGTFILLGCILAGLIIQWGQFAQDHTTLEHLRADFDTHARDTERHVDPFRDNRRWEDLIHRLDKIEEKVDDIRGKKPPR